MTLLTVILLAIAGLPLSRALDPAARRARTAGESLLFGSAAAVLLLLILALCGIEWSRATLFISLAAISITAWYLAPAKIMTPTTPATGSRLWLLLDAITVVLIVAHLLYSSLERPYEWDYFAIWGFKAHLSFTARTIPWAIFADPDFDWMAPGHPLFTPLLYDVVAIVRGRWADADLGLLATAFGAATIAIVRGLMNEEHTSRFRRSAVTLTVTPAALSIWTGLAEPFLVAFATSGVLLVRRGLQQDSRRTLAAGGVLLGCAVMTKDEGTAFLITTVIALLLTGRDGWRRVTGLWPAVVVALPWLVARRIVHIGVGVFTGDIGQRISRIARAPAVIRDLLSTPVGDHIFWWAAIVAIAISWRRAWRMERFLVAAVALQIGADVAQNFIVPWAVHPHIVYSWNRILDQVAPLTAFTAAMMMVERIERTSNPSVRQTAPARSIRDTVRT